MDRHPKTLGNTLPYSKIMAMTKAVDFKNNIVSVIYLTKITVQQTPA